MGRAAARSTEGGFTGDGRGLSSCPAVPNLGLLTSHVSLMTEVTAVLSLPWTFPLGIPTPQPSMVWHSGEVTSDQLATPHQDTAAVPEGSWTQFSLKTQTSRESLEINIGKTRILWTSS